MKSDLPTMHLKKRKGSKRRGILNVTWAWKSKLNTESKPNKSFWGMCVIMYLTYLWLCQFPRELYRDVSAAVLAGSILVCQRETGPGSCIHTWQRTKLYACADRRNHTFRQLKSTSVTVQGTPWVFCSFVLFLTYSL